MKRRWLKRTFMILGIVASLAGISACGNVRFVVPESGEEQQSNDGLLDNGVVIEKETNDKLEMIQNLIDKNFYFDEDEQELQEGLIRGYLDALDDPYSVYYTKEEYESFLQDSEGEYMGVGVQVSQAADTKVITVVKALPDSPAEAAGIQAGDIIIKVDGEDIQDQDIDSVVDKIRGAEGTEVTITFYRSSDGKEHDYTLKRAKVENPTVEYKMLENHIGYISVSSFYEVTANQFKVAVEDLQLNGMEGLIVDLRDNGGGLLDIAVEMLDYMLPAGKIVYTEDKEGTITSEYTSTDEEQFTLPLAVLVNGYSASASEIFAGAIKDYGIGTLVGTTTFGKGIVQRTFPLKDGSAIKLTIAKYFTPNGNDIHKVGIEPDVEVKFDSEAYKESKGEKDNQLQEAINTVLKKLGKEVIEEGKHDENDDENVTKEESSENDTESEKEDTDGEKE